MKTHAILVNKTQFAVKRKASFQKLCTPVCWAVITSPLEGEGERNHAPCTKPSNSLRRPASVFLGRRRGEGERRRGEEEEGRGRWGLPSLSQGVPSSTSAAGTLTCLGATKPTRSYSFEPSRSLLWLHYGMQLYICGKLRY